MVESRKPIPVTEAVSRVMHEINPLSVEKMGLEGSDALYLAEAIVADHDVPPFDRSPYDGFAILAADTTAASRERPVSLEVIESIGAGDVAVNRVKRGTAIRIMTGAALPEGADAIVKFELTREEGSNIQINRPFKSGDNLSLKGEDTKTGMHLIQSGEKVNAGIKAVLATFGYSDVRVGKQPTVGVIATGSELLDVNEPLVPGKIRNSNAYMILSQIKNAGGRPIHLAQLADEFDQSYEAIKAAISEVDVLITTGGVSVGDFDFLPAIYEKLGADVLFNKIRMRPGSVTTVARLGNKLLFGLSGNPSACFVGFELFAGPYIKALQGAKKPYLKRIKARLGRNFTKPNPFTRFVRARLIWHEAEVAVEPVGLDKSNVVTSLADANALIILPGGTHGYESGDLVDVLLLFSEGSEHFDIENLSNRRLQKQR